MNSRPMLVLSLLLASGSALLWVASNVLGSGACRPGLVLNWKLAGSGRLTIGADEGVFGVIHFFEVPRIAPLSNVPDLSGPIPWGRLTLGRFELFQTCGGLDLAPSRPTLSAERGMRVPLWATTCLFLIYPGIAHFRRVSRRPDHPACTTCGYDLTANVSGRCPECGTPVEARLGPATHE